MSERGSKAGILLTGLISSVLGVGALIFLLWASLWAGFSNFDLFFAYSQGALAYSLGQWAWLIVSLLLIAFGLWSFNKVDEDGR